jgi:hypothetical protein
MEYVGVRHYIQTAWRCEVAIPIVMVVIALMCVFGAFQMVTENL